MTLIAALATLGMALMAILQHYSAASTNALQEARLLVSEIESGMLMLRRNEKDFLARKKETYITTFSANSDLLKQRVSRLDAVLEEQGIEHSGVAALAAVLTDQLRELVGDFKIA